MQAYPFEINWNATYCDPMQPLVVDIGSGTFSEAPKHLFFIFLKATESAITGSFLTFGL